MSGVGQENNDHNGYGIMYTLPINSVCKDYGKFEKIISGDENIDVYYFMNKGANTY